MLTGQLQGANHERHVQTLELLIHSQVKPHEL
jgi:hypothetical protein